MKPSEVPDGLVETVLDEAKDACVDMGRWEARRLLANVIPGIKRQERKQVAADLKRAAAGRRDYATRASEHIAAELEAEARVFDTATRVATEPREVMWGLLPADMWTDADRPVGHGEGR